MFAIHSPHQTKFDSEIHERTRKTLYVHEVLGLYIFVLQNMNEIRSELEVVGSQHVGNLGIANSIGSEMVMLPVTTVSSQNYSTSKVNLKKEL